MRREKSILLKIIETLMNKYDVREREILYYFNLSEMNYSHLKNGKISTYKLENLVECIKILKGLNRNDLIKEIIETCFEVKFDELQ